MARRAGKSSTRRARRRRGLQTSGPRPTATDVSITPSAETEVEAPPASQQAQPRPVASSSSSARSVARSSVGGPSRLTERAIAEYHYVQQDLRNIGVLLVIMAALLIAAAIVVNVAGVGRS